MGVRAPGYSSCSDHSLISQDKETARSEGMGRSSVTMDALILEVLSVIHTYIYNVENIAFFSTKGEGYACWQLGRDFWLLAAILVTSCP